MAPKEKGTQEIFVGKNLLKSLKKFGGCEEVATWVLKGILEAQTKRTVLAISVTNTGEKLLCFDLMCLWGVGRISK